MVSMMNYKKDRIIIGDKKNKTQYKYDHPSFEICGSNFLVDTHHHIKQQYLYKGERYCIELPENYTRLGRYCCHQKAENENQFIREIVIKKESKLPHDPQKLYDYLHKMKDGIDHEKLIDER